MVRQFRKNILKGEGGVKQSLGPGIGERGYSFREGEEPLSYKTSEST